MNTPATFALLIFAGVPALLAEPAAPPTSSVPVVPIETVAKEGKWRTAILVFGNSRKLAVEEYPRREAMAWKNYDFPEKEAFVSQLKKEEEAKKNRTSLPPRPGKPL